jgi:hypothetical protein
LYSTSRIRFDIAFPGDPTAIALPLDIGRSLRGEEVTTSAFQSYPAPMLQGFAVPPRSLAMFRSEQMATLAGAIALEHDDAGSRVVNGSDLELRDAVLVDVGTSGRRKDTHLGTIRPGSTVAVVAGPRGPGTPAGAGAGAEVDPGRLLQEFRSYVEDRPENRGELRLVGWTPRPYGGLRLDPAVDRHRGYTVVVVHLSFGPPPAPDGPTYRAREPGEAATP